MKKDTLTLILGALLLSALLTICVKDLKNRIRIQEEKYIPKIGTKFVLEGDTLTIVDYSMMKETYTLSNGVKINFNLVK